MTGQYARLASIQKVGQVKIGRARRDLGGAQRRLITAIWGSDGRAYTDIGPDDQVTL